MAGSVLRTMARQLVAVQRQVEALAIFCDDRELLKCPDRRLKGKSNS